MQEFLKNGAILKCNNIKIDLIYFGFLMDSLFDIFIVLHFHF